MEPRLRWTHRSMGTDIRALAVTCPAAERPGGDLLVGLGVVLFGLTA